MNIFSQFFSSNISYGKASSLDLLLDEERSLFLQFMEHRILHKLRHLSFYSINKPDRYIYRNTLSELQYVRRATTPLYLEQKPNHSLNVKGIINKQWRSARRDKRRRLTCESSIVFFNLSSSRLCHPKYIFPHNHILQVYMILRENAVFIVQSH